jgi:uncharacterized protein YfiM (DUF2279 family)
MACLIAAATLAGCPAWPDAAVPAVIEAPAVSASVAPRDRWLGEDKAQHFAMSFAATAFAYAGARFALDPEPARITAAAAAIAGGMGKEVHDARAGRFFSVRDMAWNLAGVAAGVGFTALIR